jgi:hypothetical protein
MRRIFLLTALILSAGANFLGQAPDQKLPPLKKRASAQAVVDEHMDALNHCDWQRLMAQYPPEVQFFLPGGEVIQGREHVGELFRTLVKPFRDGGLCGITFQKERVFAVENTINVAWRATGPALAEPYRGADAYETRDGLMWAQVTTFERDHMKLK